MWFAGLVVCGGILLGDQCAVEVIQNPVKSETVCERALTGFLTHWANHPSKGAMLVGAEFQNWGCVSVPKRGGSDAARRLIWSVYGPHRKEQA
jgi:hypothetical protein